MFRVIILCVCLLTLATNVVKGKLQLPAGFTLHQVTATWEEAREQCESEGAILASPSGAVLNVMKSVMEAKRLTYHIGTRAQNTPGKYVSIEGIPLENMTVVMSDMVQQLDRSHGDCLSMNRDGVRVIPCWTELPYICHNPEIYNIKNISCVFDVIEGYKYEVATDSCYKLHTEQKQWLEAQKACVAEGAHLAVIETVEEADILKKLHKFVNNEYNMYIGLRDFTGNGDWMSVNWQRVEELYNSWLVGYKPARFENLYGVLSDQGPLDDVAAAERSFICEKRPTV